MTDTEFETQKARVLRLIEKWKAAGFGWWRIEYEWDRGDHADCDIHAEIAEVGCQWEYRAARITFRLNKVAGLSDERLEESVVHEHAHLLVASVEDYSSTGRRKRHEYAVMLITDALLWASHFSAQSGTI